MRKFLIYSILSISLFACKKNDEKVAETEAKEDSIKVEPTKSEADVAELTELSPEKITEVLKSNHSDTLYVTNFFATWCTPCIAEHPELVAFSDAHAKSGDASVVSVAYNDTPEKVVQFFAERGGDWAVIADDRSDFSIEYAVVGLPESYLVDPEGTVVHKFVGGVRKAEIEREMARNR